MICGANAPTAGSYVPAQSIQPQVGALTELGTSANNLLDNAVEDWLERRMGTTMLPVPPTLPVTPRYCLAHNTSQKRIKIEPRLQECTSCHLNVQTSYANFALCPLCSSEKSQCVICGAIASVDDSNVTKHNVDPLVPGALPEDAAFTTNYVKPVQTAEIPMQNEPPSNLLANGLAAEDQRKRMGRPWPQGGWVDSIPAASTRRIGSQTGCGPPCANDGSDGLMNIMKMFDFSSWMHCMVDSDVRGKINDDHCNGRRRMPPAQTWRGGA